MSTDCIERLYDAREFLQAHQKLEWVPKDDLVRLIDMARPFVLAEKVVHPILVAELRLVIPAAPAVEVFEMVNAVMVLARAQAAARTKS